MRETINQAAECVPTWLAEQTHTIPIAVQIEFHNLSTPASPVERGSVRFGSEGYSGRAQHLIWHCWVCGVAVTLLLFVKIIIIPL